MIEDCLKSVRFCDEVVVVDTGNTDNTNRLAKKHQAFIAFSSGNDYSHFRNDGLAAAHGDWILYVDADERVSESLAREIKKVVTEKESHLGVYEIPRQNVFLGRPMKFGGWGGDYVIRLFYRPFLKHWQFPLHEQPVFSGALSRLTNVLYHHSHRDLSSMLEKSLEFTSFEAQLRLDAHHPRMVWWRFFRVMLTEFWLRFVKLQAFRDGTEGVIDGLFQVYNTFIIYSRLWERQLARKTNQ